jgi:VCBS repeat-containing protein
VGTIPLYVVAGQSNAVRIFSTGAFQQVLDDRAAGEIGIVSAENGQSLYPSQIFNDYYPFNDGDANTGELYRDLVDDINAELNANSQVYLAGIFWLQGEEDASSSAYGPDYSVNLHELFHNLVDLFGGGFDFVISALSNYAAAAGSEPAWNTVRAAQEALANEYGHVHLIDPDHLIDVDGYTAGQVFDGDVHYKDLAYDWLAERFFSLFPVGGNTPPEAMADAFTTDEDTELAGNVLANNGSGPDSDGESDPLTVTTTPVSDVAHGTLVLNANGTFSYTPDTNFNGTDSFTYEVSDGVSGTDTAVVTITVNAVNDDPIAGDDSGFTVVNTAPLEIAAATLLANDEDGDPDLDQSLTITSVSGAVNGTVSLDAGTITFTPATDHVGPASFTYVVSDGAGGTDTATVSLDITDNQPPVAVSDAFSVDEDSTVAGNVLDNDNDPEGDSLTATLVSGPAEGVLTFEASGAFSYEADADLFDLAAPGTVIEQTFTYEVSDSHGGSDQATVTLSVTILDDGQTLIAGDHPPGPVTGTDGGEDLILGGMDDDLLRGLDGADTLLGGHGQDRLYGGDSVDRLSGHADADRLSGGKGDDQMFGGGGNDWLAGNRGDDLMVGGKGFDTMRGGADNDRLKGLDGRDRLLGGAGDDVLIGGKHNDVLRGSAGDDGLRGGGGDDRIFGGSGDDKLFGRMGHDRMAGNSGADTFFFKLGEGTDTVLDFTDGEDLLAVDGLSYGDLTILQTGADSTISVGGEIVAVLLNVDVSLITESDFV